RTTPGCFHLFVLREVIELSSRDTADRVNQSLHLFFGGVAGAAGADQPSLFGKTESFNDCRGVKVPVRNKNPFLGETSGNLAGRDIFNGKSDRRRPRFLRRGAIGPYAIDFAEAAPKSPNEALAAFLQPSERCSQPFAPRSILRQRCQEV